MQERIGADIRIGYSSGTLSCYPYDHRRCDEASGATVALSWSYRVFDTEQTLDSAIMLLPTPGSCRPGVRSNNGTLRTLVIGEPDTLALELGSQNPILFLNVVDHVPLLSVHPASAGHEKELPCLKSVYEGNCTQPQPECISP